MQTVDFHCDALSKLWEDSSASFKDDPRLDVSLERMIQGHVDLQVFAVFVSEQYGRPSFERVLAQIEVFRRRLAEPELVKPLLWKEQVQALREGCGKQRYGLLSLEGVDGLEGNLHYVRLCYELGVRCMGITWNYANWAADGAMESRNGGFTERGRELVRLCNEIGMVLDVSHLSEAGFWELMELTSRPVIASHSNAHAICPHPRNLRDDQIRALISLDGRIGITFVPWFIRSDGRSDGQQVKAEDLLPHIEKICELGGAKHLMFGSDFDGIDRWVEGLAHPGHYPALQELLLKYYPEDEVRGWMSGNALRFLEGNLPSRAKDKS